MTKFIWAHRNWSPMQRDWWFLTRSSRAVLFKGTSICLFSVPAHLCSFLSTVLVILWAKSRNNFTYFWDGNVVSSEYFKNNKPLIILTSIVRRLGFNLISDVTIIVHDSSSQLEWGLRIVCPYLILRIYTKIHISTCQQSVSDKELLIIFSELY